MHLEFTATVRGNSGEGYRIYIPKETVRILPKDAWMVRHMTIHGVGFIQDFGPHSISKTTNRRFIPIYKDEVTTEYTSHGRMTVMIEI